MHILIFGKAEFIYRAIKNMPQNITILVDHFAMATDVKDQYFKELLELAAKRGNVFFKGPGYRSSLNVDNVKIIVKAIYDKLGSSKIILGASDAPFAGIVGESDPRYNGKKFNEIVDFKFVWNFINQLADHIVRSQDEKQKLFYGNAAALYE